MTADEYIDQEIIVVSVKVLDELKIEKYRSKSQPHDRILYALSFVRDIEDVVESRGEVSATVYSTETVSQDVNLSGSALDEDVYKRHDPPGRLHPRDHAEKLQVVIDPGIRSSYGRLISFVRVWALSPPRVDHSIVHGVVDHVIVDHCRVDNMCVCIKSRVVQVWDGAHKGGNRGMMTTVRLLTDHFIFLELVELIKKLATEE